MLRRSEVATAFRVAGFVSISALVVLSFVPGTMRPHLLGSGNAEHFLAYAGTAFFLGLGYVPRTTAVFVSMLSAAAAFVELLQNWIPGRSPGFDNFVSSSMGALLGAAVAISLATLVRKVAVPPIER